MRSAKTLSRVVVMALPAALALSTTFAEMAPTVGGVPVTTGQLGPPLPVPGQPNPVPWQQRLLWLQQQIRVLGRDPGPNQDIFNQLARQIDAVVAAIPGMIAEAGAGIMGWPTQQSATASPGTQPALTVISPSVLQQQPPSGTTAQVQISPPDQSAGMNMGAGGSVAQAGPAPAPPPGPPQGPPPPPPAGPQAARPPGPSGQPPLPASETQRKMNEIFRFSRELEHTVTDPMQVAILAVQAVADVSKDNPETGIGALQALLQQEQLVPLRTVIHFALKDLYAKAGQHDAALQQLQAIVRENGKLLGEGEPRPPYPGRMPPPPPRGGDGMLPPPRGGEGMPHRPGGGNPPPPPPGEPGPTGQ